MKSLPLQARTLALLAVILPLLLVFIYVVFRSGPLAPVLVTVTTVQSGALTPSLFGIGIVDAQFVYKIGPTAIGRLKALHVHVGDRVKAGEPIGEMDVVDLDDRIRSQESAIRRTEALLQEASARQAYAKTEALRYEKLLETRSVNEESAALRQEALQIANAALAAAGEELARIRSDKRALQAQREQLHLVAPVDGIVTSRNADPGSTIIGGQAVVEIIDPASLWINVRFDQNSAAGLAAGLPARIVLRSASGKISPGHVLRIEPRADAVTEEILAKVVFTDQPASLPPIGELAEITVDLPALPESVIIPNAALKREGNTLGVWRVVDDRPVFTALNVGASSLNGDVQVIAGLNKGDRIVVYSEKMLAGHSRIRVVEALPGTTR